MGASKASASRSARPLREQPTRRAALAGIIVAALALAWVGVAALWDRPASVPTYAAEEWSGEDAVGVSSAVDVRAAGLFAACPTIWLADGSRAGALLVDGWAASIPGLAFSERLPVLRAEREGLRTGDGRGATSWPIEVRVLDAATAHDAALADAWVAACGDGVPIVMVAPDAVLESLALMP